MSMTSFRDLEIQMQLPEYQPGQAVRIKTLGVLLVFLTSPADWGGRNHRTPVADIKDTLCLS